MKLQDVQKTNNNNKTKILSVRISDEYFEFLKKNKLSITKVVNVAIAELISESKFMAKDYKQILAD